MNVQVEDLGKNMAKLTVEVPAEQFDAALKTAFDRNRNRFNIPGFRRGKAPQVMVERMYGPEVLYEDAANVVLDATYPDAAEESKLDIVSRPEIDLVQIGKGENLIYTAEVAVKPEATLGEYKGIQVERTHVEVTDREVDDEIERVRDQNARLVTVDDRPAKDGDQVTLDFEGFVNGKAFEGGKGEDYPLTIGSHSFIGDFEEQLIGMERDGEREVRVTFPEDYHVRELAGKPALFRVRLKEIKMKELPEADDEFASEVSDFETMDEYRADLRSKLLESRERQAAAENENRVVERVVANASLDIPAPMLETQVRNMIDDYGARLQSQGLTLEQYFKYTGETMEDLEKQIRPQAEQRIRTRLVLEAVVKAENLQADEQAVENEVKSMAARYKLEEEQIRDQLGESGIAQIREDLAVQEAIDFLVAEATLV